MDRSGNFKSFGMTTVLGTKGVAGDDSERQASVHSFTVQGNCITHWLRHQIGRRHDRVYILERPLVQPFEGWNGGNQDAEPNSSQRPIVRAQIRNDES